MALVNLAPPAPPMGATVRTRRRSTAKALVVALDGLCVVIAMAVAFPLATGIGSLETGRTHLHVVVAVLALPLWLMVFAKVGLYQHRRISNVIDEWQRLLWGVAGGVLVTSATGFLADIAVSRAWVATAGVTAFAMLVTERSILRRRFSAERRRGRLRRPVVLVGVGAEVEAIEALVRGVPDAGYEVVDRVVLDDHINGISAGGLATVIVNETVNAIDRTGAVGVMVASSAMPGETLNRLVRDLVDLGVHVELPSSLRDISTRRLSMRALGRFPITYVEPVRRDGWRAVAKRTLDIGLAGSLLLATLPSLVIAGILVRLTSPGPALFRQKRVGLYGREFSIFKLRTMVADAESQIIDLRDSNEADGPLFKMKHDPRVTPVGRVLRRLSVDELPQLWNVLRGEMSLVGPRPALPHEVDQWMPELYQRLRVKPGITGAWQVGGRSNASFDDYVRLDLYYVDNWSLVTDLVIVAKTLPSMLLRRGAY